MLWVDDNERNRDLIKLNELNGTELIGKDRIDLNLTELNIEMN